MLPSALAPRLAVLLLATAPWGCRRSDEAPTPAASESAAAEAGYLAPPRAIAATATRDGGLRVFGLAPPRSTVEITSPEGERRDLSADDRGNWSVRLATATPRLYAISAAPAGRTLHAEGALLTVPGAPPLAVVLRAGYAAVPLNPTPAAAISAVDYDPGGSIAISGAAAPRAQLTLMVDGAPAATGQADEQGLYALMATSRRLAFGQHLLEVRGPGGVVKRAVTLQPPVALDSPYRAWPEPDGWRVEWALNGGGVQTTLILNR